MKSAKLFVGCLPGDAQTSELTALFRRHAQINSITLAKKANEQGNSYCVGYGFVICQDRLNANKLLQKSRKLLYRDRLLIFREFKSGKNLIQEKNEVTSRRLFIGNLPPSATDRDLEHLFSKFGQLETAYIVDKPQSNGRYYGYVVFLTESAVYGALNLASSLQIHGSSIKLEPFNGKKSLIKGFDTFREDLTNWNRPSDLDSSTVSKQNPEKPIFSKQSASKKRFQKTETVKTLRNRNIYGSPDFIKKAAIQGAQKTPFLAIQGPFEGEVLTLVTQNHYDENIRLRVAPQRPKGNLIGLSNLKGSSRFEEKFAKKLTASFGTFATSLGRTPQTPATPSQGHKFSFQAASLEDVQESLKTLPPVTEALGIQSLDQSGGSSSRRQDQF